MKKQILFLALFVLAVFTTSTALGQSLASSTTPRPGTCVSEPLHPKAGVSYPYTVNSTAGDVVSSYTWWATKSTSFIDNSGITPIADTTNMLEIKPNELIAADATYGKNTGTATVNITWTPQILASTGYQNSPAPKTSTFVVVMANGSCTNNIQAFEIAPLPSFTVDVTNVDPTTLVSKAYDEDAPQCVDRVHGAVYNAGALDMDYGKDTLYFEVIAANFVASWTPTVQLDGLQGDQTAQVDWAYLMTDFTGGTSGTITSLVAAGAGANGTPYTSSAIVTTALPNTVDGVSIFVRVIVDNNTFETLTDSPISLIVDGEDSTGQFDLVNADCSDPGAADQDDVAFQTINARPTVIDATTPETLPNPDDLIPKN